MSVVRIHHGQPNLGVIVLRLFKFLIPLFRIFAVISFAILAFLWAVIVDYEFFKRLFSKEEWDGTKNFIRTGRAN